MPDDTVPPTNLPPDISLILAGFHILVPGGGVKALPYLQVFISNGPWLTAPAGAISLALLSTPARAANGKSFCWASAAVTDMQTTAHAAAIPTKSLIIVSSAFFWLRLKRENRDSGAAEQRPGSTGWGQPYNSGCYLRKIEDVDRSRMERSVIRGQPIPDYAAPSGLHGPLTYSSTRRTRRCSWCFVTCRAGSRSHPSSPSG